eukprot:GGOE01062057.1.p1 GENE.GGOE01062057.1~~GGOE01062057.1.p1  ORF type:complete len:581 (-),score=174.55 GGOE01062057.1:183-1838(-)
MAGADRDWGFTAEELATCVKVVHALHNRPELLMEDPDIRATELFRFINPRKDWKHTLKVFNAERNKHGRQLAREKERAMLAKTQLRQERNAALERVLALEQQRPPLLLCEDGPPHEEQQQQLHTEVLPDDTQTLGEAEAEEEGKVGDGRMARARKCHICKQRYDALHFFYCSLCPDCADLNWQKRHQKADLQGKTVLLTGARIKIGFQIALSLLRCGATLIATSRFVSDAASRFDKEPDCGTWRHNLHLHRLDLRDLAMVTAFCDYVTDHFPALFAIINNAAQTVRRPPEYYLPLLRREQQGSGSPLIEASWPANSTTTLLQYLAPGFAVTRAPLPSDRSGVPAEHTGTEVEREERQPLPAGSAVVPLPGGIREVDVALYDMYDTLQNRLDRREQNSWTATLAEVSGEEAAEVHAINTLAPFILVSRLKPLLVAHGATARKFVVNVSAMEGQFYRFKGPTHPHTNMAKAALNMMTRTSAADYAQDRIYMNSVDTGWITDESPLPKQDRKASKDQLFTPLDEVDAAARVLDLIYTDSEVYGRFWKDFQVVPW